MNGALNERRMRRRRGRRGLKRERGLATPLPIHWPIILTNGLCSHRALCFHSLPRSKDRTSPETSIERRFKERSFFFAIFLWGAKKELILIRDSLERICWKDLSNLRKGEPSVSIVYRRERERKVRTRSLVTFRRVERNLLNIVRRKIVFLVEEEGVSRLNIIGRLTLDLIEIPFSSKKGCFDHRENKNSSIFGSMLL